MYKSVEKSQRLAHVQDEQDPILVLYTHSGFISGIDFASGEKQEAVCLMMSFSICNSNSYYFVCVSFDYVGFFFWTQKQIKQSEQGI